MKGGKTGVVDCYCKHSQADWPRTIYWWYSFSTPKEVNIVALAEPQVSFQ